MIEFTQSAFIWVGLALTVLVVVYLGLLVIRYEKHRKSNISLAVDLPSITAYAYPNAYKAGDSLQLYVHAEQAYTGNVYRLGDGEFVPVHTFSGQASVQSDQYDLKYGHDWSLSHSIPTNGWKAGFYLIQLRFDTDANTSFSVPVVLREPEGHDILVVVPTNTWQAYNEYGGKSNYRDKVTPPDLRALFNLLKKSSPGLVPYNYLPARRPLDHPIALAPIDGTLGHLNGKVSSDLHLIRYLEELTLNYGVISDGEFYKLAGERRPKLIIFNNHSEYWAYEGIGRVKNFLKNGTSVAFLSGNNMYREVETTDHGSLIVMEQQTPRVAVEPLLGTYYSQSGYQTYASFRVAEPGNWAFASTGLALGDTFGEGVISGLETDKLGPYSEGFTLLAVGTNPAGPAHMVMKDYPQGNFLFNASSVSSVRAIPQDAAWRQIILNLINRAVNDQ